MTCLADYLIEGQDNTDRALMERACSYLGHQWSPRDPLRMARFCERDFGALGLCGAVLTDQDQEDRTAP